MKRGVIIAAFVTAFSMVCAACTEVYVYVGEDRTNGASPQPGSGSVSLITFHASVESRNMQTRSMTPIGKNIRAQLFAYASDAASSSTAPVAYGVYEAAEPGMLAGMNGYRMYLTNGMYDFYGFSENMAYTPLVFDDGKSAPLFNGVDYLWWHGNNQDVASTQLSVPVVFMHMATQVVFEVRAENGITLNQLVAAHITAPQQGAQMDLRTGVIPPATDFLSGAPDKMGVNGTLAQYIMLPLRTTKPMTASFTVLVNGESADRTYSVDVPVPDGELAAGNSYRFAVVIQANGVAFDSVNVANWVDVDETGKPLYPVQ